MNSKFSVRSFDHIPKQEHIQEDQKTKHLKLCAEYRT